MRRLAFAALVLFATPAFAQNKEESTAADQNKVICRNEEVIGSHLQTTRTCLTKQQWAQKRREDRDTVSRIQNQKALNGG